MDRAPGSGMQSQKRGVRFAGWVVSVSLLAVGAGGSAACSASSGQGGSVGQEPLPAIDVGTVVHEGGPPPSPSADAGTPIPMPMVHTCSPNDVVSQKLCGAGLACDYDRSVAQPGVGTGSADAGASDAGSSGVGGADGGHDGGGNGMGNGGGNGMGNGGGNGMGDGGGGGGGNGMGDGGGGGHVDGGAAADGGGAGGGGGGGTGPKPVVCRMFEASGTEGVPCNVADPATCASGYTCGTLDDGSPTSDAICNKFCNTDSDCTAPGGMCRVALFSMGGVGPMNGKTCSLDCDPMKQTGCGTGQNCDLAISGDRTRIYTECIHAGAGAHMAACTQAEDCNVGSSCLKLRDTSGNLVEQVCLELCVVGAATSTCPTGTTCTAVAAPNTLGTTEYGWCY